MSEMRYVGAEKDLIKYGFVLGRDEDDYYLYNNYYYDIGHSRHGQHYYIIILSARGHVLLYANEPDGSSGAKAMPDVIIRMLQDGVLKEA